MQTQGDHYFVAIAGGDIIAWLDGCECPDRLFGIYGTAAQVPLQLPDHRVVLHHRRLGPKNIS